MSNVEELRSKIRALPGGIDDPASPASSSPEAPPDTWIGTFAELDALDLPEPALLASVGEIPVYASETMLMWGPSNVGKSLLALRIVVSVALTGARVLIVEGEGSKRALRQRIRRIARGLRDQGVDDAAENITITHGNFGLEEHVALWRDLLERTKPTIVMVDPLVSYFRGDENAARDMHGFLALVDIAKAAGAAVIVVHHGTKPDANGNSRERGSSALRGWADESMQIGRGAQPTETLVTHDKTRDHEKKLNVQRLTWAFSDDAIACDAGVADPDATVAAATKKRRTKILGLLAEHGEISLADARKQCGNLGGTLWQEFIDALEKAEKLHRVEGEKLDKIGRRHGVTMLRPGPATAGTSGVATVAGTSTCPPDASDEGIDA